MTVTKQRWSVLGQKKAFPQQAEHGWFGKEHSAQSIEHMWGRGKVSLEREILVLIKWGYTDVSGGSSPWGHRALRKEFMGSNVAYLVTAPGWIEGRWVEGYRRAGGVRRQQI